MNLQSAKLLYSSQLTLVGRKDFSFTSVGLKCSTVKWKINLKCYPISQILAHALLTGDSSSSAADLHLTLCFLPLQLLGFKKQTCMDIILVLSVTFFIPDFWLLEECLMELVVSFMWSNRSTRCGNMSCFPLYGKNPPTGNNVSVLLLYVLCLFFFHSEIFFKIRFFLTYAPLLYFRLLWYFLPFLFLFS